MGKKISYILDGGESQVGIESTIVGFEGDDAVVYRLGGVSVEELENAIGSVKVVAHSSSNPKAPGMLKSHYSPRKPLFIKDLQQLFGQYPKEGIGYLSFQKTNKNLPLENQRILSISGNYAEAAKHLFSYMRQLDSMSIDVIYAELLPEKDLGRAINDRIRRAAVRE